MKPDGVATAAMEPMEALDANPLNEPVPMGEEPNQAPASAPQTEAMIGQPGEIGQGEPQPQPEPAKQAATKTGGTKAPADPKAKTTTKAPAKTKPGTTGTAKTATGPGTRPTTAQSRLTNGVAKPQTNGVAKKTPATGAPEKKSTTAAAAKRPVGTAGAPASKAPTTKVADKKPAGTTRPASAPSATNGVKTATGTTTAAKKTPVAPTNGVKTTTAPATAAKKPAAPRPASAATTKPSTAAAPKPPVSKTTRPATAPGSRPATASTAKSSTSTAKPATPASKTTPTTPKPAAAKPSSTTPSAGRTPTPQAAKTTTPVKKDVTKPATPAAKKPAASPLTRPSTATKTTKPDTPKSAPAPKSDSAVKKPAASSKAPDTKTTKAKTQESKPTPSKDATASPKPKPAAKASSPKKAVGSSTPMPVKRGPKPTTAGEPAAKEEAAPAVAAPAVAAPAVAAAAVGVVAAATAAAVTMATSASPSAEEMELVSTTQTSQAEEAAPEASIPQLSAQLDLVHLGEPADDLVSPLGTTVMSPPCSPPRSPPGPMSPVREPQNASHLLGMHVQPDPWSHTQPLVPSAIEPQSPTKVEVSFQQAGEEEEEEEEEEKKEKEMEKAETKETKVEEEEEEEEDEEQEDHQLPTSTAPSAATEEPFSLLPQPNLLGSSPMDDFTTGSLISPSQEREEAVEKADEEINEDDDDDYDEEEEERKVGKQQQQSPLFNMSSPQPSEEFQAKPAGFGGAGAGWQGEDLLSGMDSEDVSSMSSSRGQPRVSEMSSTQNTGLLEGTQSSDALVDSSLRGSEGDGNFMNSPNVETLANEEEEEDEEDEHDMDVSSERAEDHRKVCQQEEEEDEDEEMPSEGVTESGLESVGYVDEDDLDEEDRLDNLNRGPQPPIPPVSAWGGQLNPFADPWTPPAHMVTTHSASSPLSDHGAADPETPTQSPAQAWLDLSNPALVPQSEQPYEHQSAQWEMESSAPVEASAPPAPPAVGMSQSSTLSGTALAAHSSSETSTPEELRDYDSSSGVESRSDKLQTPVPTSVQPDLEQDLGIHLERGDGEEEEAETLPADEVLGAGPPTAPASAPSSPSTSGDEASDTEGEMQINDPDAPITMDGSAGYDSPPPARNLPALDEDEEVVEAQAGEGEEDGGGGTPQSANSVASYGFDCTTSNSNAHSTAESCGKSPGIFSLENEDQLPEEAKDPSFIKELTLPAAAAQAEDLMLGGPVDLLPLGHPGDDQDDHHHYMLGGKMGADALEEVDPLEPNLRLGSQHAGEASDGQAPYYSAICDKTDSFLAGEHKSDDDDDDDDDDDARADESQRSPQKQEDDLPSGLQEVNLNLNQNQLPPHPVANGHYLAEVPGNRRRSDPLSSSTSRASPQSAEAAVAANSQLRRLEQHQHHLRELQQRQEQERQKKQWLEEERLRLEQQRQLEKQRRELLQLQLQQQQQEHRHRRQVLQWQLELEQQHRQQQKQQQQQQPLRRSPSAVMLSPSSGLCTIYEAMETSEEEDEGEMNANNMEKEKRSPSSFSQTVADSRRHVPRPVPPQDLTWSTKVDIVQQLINQTLLLSGDGGCPPLLLLPVGSGGTLSPLESSMWPSLLPPLSPPSATITSVSSYSPDSQGSSPGQGDWTVVELETQH